MPELRELTRFSPDSESTEAGKNSILAALLAGSWSDLAIVRIERVEIGNQKGWRVTYRE